MDLSSVGASQIHGVIGQESASLSPSDSIRSATQLDVKAGKSTPLANPVSAFSPSGNEAHFEMFDAGPKRSPFAR